TDDVLLPQDLVGTLGPVLAVEGLVVLVGHGDKQAIAPGRHRWSERSNRRFRGTLGGHDDGAGGRTAPRRPRLPSVLVGPDGLAGRVLDDVRGPAGPGVRDDALAAPDGRRGRVRSRAVPAARAGGRGAGRPMGPPAGHGDRGPGQRGGARLAPGGGG